MICLKNADCVMAIHLLCILNADSRLEGNLILLLIVRWTLSIDRTDWPITCSAAKLMHGHF